jgi:hypothetical protein
MLILIINSRSRTFVTRTYDKARGLMQIDQGHDNISSTKATLTKKLFT